MSEDAPQWLPLLTKTRSQVGIFLVTVNRIIKNDLQLKCHKTHRTYELTDGNKKKKVLSVAEKS